MNRRKTLTTPPLRPPREGGTGRAFLLAALMHVLLVALLYRGVQWQNSTPAGVEAELWTEVPDSPVPPLAPPVRVAPAPPPASVQDDDAEIALQQKRRQQQEAAAREAQLAQQQAAEKQKQADKLRQQQLAEQKKLEQQRKKEQAQADTQKKAEAEKAAAKAKATAAAFAKLDKERETRLAKLQGAAGGQGGSDGLAKSDMGSGSGGNATSPGYADKVKRRVRPFIVWNGATEGLVTRVQVRCSPTGDVLGTSVVKPSGNSAWDKTVVGALRAASPLPPDTNGSTPANIAITFRAAE
ncbi:MAG: cell envelope integrity protein TolA [Burkholderia sp.]